jgi:hypothetical protein
MSGVTVTVKVAHVRLCHSRMMFVRKIIYRAWLENLPPNLEGSRLAEKLQAIAELDLAELETIDPPRGYGRD